MKRAACVGYTDDEKNEIKLFLDYRSSTVTKLVPLTVVPYGEIYLPWKKRKCPFSKPLLDLEFVGVVGCKSITSEFYF